MDASAAELTFRKPVPYSVTTNSSPAPPRLMGAEVHTEPHWNTGTAVIVPSAEYRAAVAAATVVPLTKYKPGPKESICADPDDEPIATVAIPEAVPAGTI